MQSFRMRQIEILSESDGDLFERIRKGDQFAVKELFRRYYGNLCRFAYRSIHSRDDVEDIVEGVFEKVWLNRDKLNSIQSVKSYLFKAVQNQAIDFLRSKENKHVVFSERTHSEKEMSLEVISCSDPFQDMTERDLAAAVAEAIENLPNKCKRVFTMNRQDSLKYSEIADVLNISERTVENQIVRALKHLKKELRDFLG